MKNHIIRQVFFWLVSAFVLLNGPICGAAEWPMFRGSAGDGSAPGPRLPLKWSETENVRWKTAIPHKGWSTPVIQDGLIWLTSATEKGNEYHAFCVDVKTGKVFLRKKLFTCDKPEPLGNKVNSYASPSPVIEPGRVYIHFGSYGTVCLDSVTGKEIWRRDDLECRHYRGPGSSAILYKNTLILTFDGVDVQYVTALDKRTGKTAWKTGRDIKWNDLGPDGKPKKEGDLRKGFSTPLVINAGGGRDQLISPASTCVFGYEASSGREIWRVNTPGHTPAVSPVFHDGLVLTCSGHKKTELLAIRPNGKGDVTKTHVAWRMKGKDVPTIPSPIIIDGLAYVPNNRGIVSCLELKSGRAVWRERIGGSYLASPIHNNERIYLFSTSGKSVVLRAGRSFKKLAENRLDEGCMASPAVTGDDLVIRTKTHLYCIGK